MQSYITETGLQLLKQAFNGQIPPLSLTGSQVGTAYGFVPTALQQSAVGTVLIDNKNNPSSVLSTRVHFHESIYSVYLNQTFEFTQIGNVLIFANNQPFLWNISDIPMSKLKINPITHFAGDEYYFSIVFRYPYLRNLINFDVNYSLHAKFPTFKSTREVTIPEHTLADQILVESNDLTYGNSKPFYVAKSELGWVGTPIMNLMDSPDFLKIDGGGTTAGF